MRSRILLLLSVLLAVILFPSGCGTNQGCLLCGTTVLDGVVIIDVMAVPGAVGPGGTAFTVFDIGMVDSANHRYYITDRSQNVIGVYDTTTHNPSVIGPAVPAVGQIGQGVFTGAVCCAPNRAANFNPLTGPNGIVITPGGSTKFGLIWAGDGDSTVKVFDAGTGAPVGTVVTGVPRDPTMIPQCISAGTGCGDFRADEMSFDPADNLLLVANGDPGVPFVTLIDTTNPACLNNSCVKGQIFFGDLPVGSSVCPAGTGVRGALGQTVKCAHAPGGQGGLGGSAFNPRTGRFLVSNTQNTPNAADSEVTEIDPKATNFSLSVTNDFQLAGLGCQPSFITIGPPPNVLVSCENFAGTVTFTPSEIVIDGGTGKIVSLITKVGGVDEAAYNPTDNRYYVAARDMPTGPVLGVIDAATNTWLQNVTTGSNAHSVAVEPANSHIFVPLQPSPSCRAFRVFGCIAVYAQQ